MGTRSAVYQVYQCNNLVDRRDRRRLTNVRARVVICVKISNKNNISTLDGVRLRKTHTREWRKTLMISDFFFNFQTLNFINFWTTDCKNIFDTWIWNASRWFLMLWRLWCLWRAHLMHTIVDINTFSFFWFCQLYWAYRHVVVAILKYLRA